MDRPSVYEYLDYRAFLKDMFGFRKQMSKIFSHRFFARQSGFSSPNFLKLVTDGKRNLTADSIAKVAKGFKLTKPERDFFENLVFMNQADSHDERNHYYQKMIGVKGYTAIYKLEKASYEYFSKWYHPVIRELLLLDGKNYSSDEIAAMLKPSITPGETEKSIRLLNDIGLIQKDESGKWVTGHSVVTTGREVRSLVIANYHREMMKLAGEAIERFPSEQRDITAVTISVRRDRMADIKEKTAAFRKELLEMACREPDADQVIQVNIQVFPLSS